MEMLFFILFIFFIFFLFLSISSISEYEHQQREALKACKLHEWSLWLNGKFIDDKKIGENSDARLRCKVCGKFQSIESN